MPSHPKEPFICSNEFVPGMSVVSKAGLLLSLCTMLQPSCQRSNGLKLLPLKTSNPPDSYNATMDPPSPTDPSAMDPDESPPTPVQKQHRNEQPSPKISLSQRVVELP